MIFIDKSLTFHWYPEWFTVCTWWILVLLCRVPEAGSGAHQAVRPQDGSDEGNGFDYFTVVMLVFNDASDVTKTIVPIVSNCAIQTASLVVWQPFQFIKCSMHVLIKTDAWVACKENTHQSHSHRSHLETSCFSHWPALNHLPSWRKCAQTPKKRRSNRYIHIILSRWGGLLGHRGAIAWHEMWASLAMALIWCVPHM